ncbi:MAG: hydroxymethylbilane synthase [Clostridiales bacterium]|nr:hydroxymethylbilane synthase [Clostridiales bacterium]
MVIIRIGSRESRLAIIQAEIVQRHLRQMGCDTELVTMKTSGDRLLNQTLDKIGGKGLFIKELDNALLNGSIDLAVHSCKDLPIQLDERLPLVAVSAREDARDALVLPLNCHKLDTFKPLGCSSARRTLQLKHLYPNNEVKPLRGNVLTRLAKLDNGDYAGIVLALAGLKRLGLAERANRIFEIREMLPAAGQGILAVQARREFDTGLLEGFHSVEAWDAMLAERSFVAALGGDCSSPVAAYAEISGVSMNLSGLFPMDNGDFTINSIAGSRAEAGKLGHTLATMKPKASI